ncbi:MAG: hypothetical protein HDR29_03205 [Lachnospiraceae bacterium]|nr:hypothetical protein [Lachnospiraceae bacterium]
MIPIYVNDIMSSLENKCYFTALSLALTLPDICGMAEYPDKSVSERYIEWYDKYLGDYMAQGKDILGGNNPWLSGEIIYNLRNTYLHQGDPTIANNKVKEEANRFDAFILLLGDGTVLQSVSLNINAGTQETGKITYKSIIVDITYLCNVICDCALWYYKNNPQKFKFNFSFITQEELIHPSEKAPQFAEGDVLLKTLNHKLEKEGSTKRFVEDPNRNTIARMSEDLNIIFSDESMKQRFLNGDSTFTHQAHLPSSLAETNRNDMNEKREAQVRSFFGRHFKEKIYRDKKEEIIQAVLNSKTKQQVNNNLMKHFTSQKAGVIYRRLAPLLKDLPAK